MYTEMNNELMDANEAQAEAAPTMEVAAETDNEANEKGLTLEQLINRFFADYRAGRWKDYKVNTDNSTQTDLPRLVAYFGNDRDVTTITESEAADFMDTVSCSLTKRSKKKKIPMTEAGALAIYYSARRIFDYGKEMGFMPGNVFRTMRSVSIPKPNKGNTAGARLNEEECKRLAKALLDHDSDFGAVRSVLFILLAYGSHLRPGDLLVLTWAQLEKMEAAGEISSWASRLIKTYRPAQKQWLEDSWVDNPAGYVFVNCNIDSGVAQAASAGTAGTWLRDKILKPLGLPLVTINVLASKNDLTPQNAFEDMDPMADYPIFGTVKFLENAFGKSGKSPEERAREVAEREAYLAQCKAKQQTGQHPA